MNAIAFLTVFLSLVSGPQWVEVAVQDSAGEVARVELVLDDRVVAALGEAPWGAEIDFGDDLRPHHLQAVAYDADGREVQRLGQWLNLPRGRSDLSVVVEETASGARQVRLLWASVDRQPPDDIIITYDGVPLEPAPGTALLLPPPPADEPRGTLHLLVAELRFGGEVVRSEVALGGEFGSSAASELTAIPILLPPDTEAPDLDLASSWVVRRDGAPTSVSAVEAGSVDVVVIHDRDPEMMHSMGTVGGVSQLLKRLQEGFAAPVLRKRDRLRMVLPGAPPQDAEDEESEAVPVSFFPLTRDFGGTPGGLTRLVVTPMRFEASLEDRLKASPQRLSDALAVSGLAATSGGRRRAVVLIANSNTADYSAYRSSQALSFLESLRVPLVVWDPEGDSFGPWGPSRDTSSAPKLTRALEDLRTFLDRQVVLWVEGRHLPQDLVLTAAARNAGVALAGVGSEGRLAPLPASENLLLGGADEVEPLEALPLAATALVDGDEDSMAAAFGTFSEVVKVSLVTLDVFARDDDGQPVTDLSQEDFRVTVDGEPVELSHFRAPAPVIAQAEVDAGATEGTSGGPVDLGATDAEPLSLVVLSDLRQPVPGLRHRLLEGLREVLVDEELPARVMVLAHDQRIETVQPFTRSRDELLAAVDRLAQRARPGVAEGERARLLNDLARVSTQIVEAQRRGDALGLQVAYQDRDVLLAQVEAYSRQQRELGRDTLADLETLVASLGALPGRTALLYVGDRLGLQPGSEHVAMLEFLDLSDSLIARFQSRAEMNNLDEELEALAERASAHEVLLYILSAGADGDTSLDVAVASGGSSPLLRTRVRSTRDADARAGACLPAEASGGRCQVGGAEPNQLLERALEDLETGYSLAFPAPAAAAEGQALPLKVEVTRSGVELRYRREVVVAEPDQALLARVEAALTLGAESNPLRASVASSTEPTRVGDDGDLRVELDLRLPLQAVTLLPSADGDTLEGNLRLLIISRDEEGRRGDLQRYDIPLSVPAKQMRRHPGGLYSQPIHLTLWPAHHQLVLGLWDTVGQLGSFLIQELDLSEPSETLRPPGTE